MSTSTDRCPLEPWAKLDYHSTQLWKHAAEVEEARAKDDRTTNYRLKDGDSVMLRHGTIVEGARSDAYAPPGTFGVVTHARTPRVKRRAGKGSLYFANVRIVGPDALVYTARVPHSALSITKPKSLS